MLAELSDLVHALENDGVVPCYQPIVDLRTGGLRGFEVLARWVHPDAGLVLPLNFIALAEDNGLIGELTNQVLRKAFAGTMGFEGTPRLAVNISPRQMRYSSLPGQIRNSAEEAGFPLDRLTIEITESALLENLDLAGKIACALKDMGCNLSLDDFGTGYSSLRHLHALPFDEIKIDRSFVTSMTTRRESRKIVAATVGLGHSLDLVTVAEGVEQDDQAELLLRMGCQLAQGWRYGKPRPAHSLAEVAATKPHGVPSAVAAAAKATHGKMVLEALPAMRMAQMQAIYDGAPMGLCFVDCSLRIVSLNEKLAAINGIPLEAQVGRTIQELFPEWFACYEGVMRRALAGEALPSIEMPTADGKGKILTSYQPVRDEADEVVGISIAVMDLTEHLAPANGSERHHVAERHEVVERHGGTERRNMRAGKRGTPAWTPDAAAQGVAAS